MGEIAVLVAAYNAEAVLDGALASVAAQTFPPSEVIVVDDGSTDRTAVVANRWRGLLPLRLVQHPRNRGLGQSRITLLNAATTELVTFLDADDLWLPEHLETMRAAHKRATDIVSPDAYRWSPGKRFGYRTQRWYAPVPPPARQREEILRRNFVFVGSLFHRQAAHDAGGVRDGFPGVEDWDLWIRMLRQGATVTPTASPTVLYRLSPKGLTLSGVVAASVERMLAAAAEEAPTPAERELAERTRSRVAARRTLAAARAAAAAGDLVGARSAARAVGRGSISARIEAEVLQLLPRLALRAGTAWRRHYW